MDIIKALKYLTPGAQWSLSGDTYDGLEWRDLVIPKPSEDALQSAYAAVLAQEKATAYQGLRSDAYPGIGDQLDMIWHAMDSNLIPMAKEFYDARKAVKEQYPKPRGN